MCKCALAPGKSESDKKYIYIRLHQQELLQTAHNNCPFVFRLLLELLVQYSILGFLSLTSHPEGPHLAFSGPS